MNAYDLITEKIKYNQWANRMIMDWLKDQPDELWTREVSSSFPTLNKLLHHMMESEVYYLSILSGKEADYQEELDTERIFLMLQEVDEQLLRWIQTETPDSMDAEISLKRSPVVETYTTATLLTHLLNHGTYHRGQIVAMRHQLGIPPPPRTDYYRYFIYLSTIE